MTHEEKVRLDILFGSLELLEAPPRIEGRWLVSRGRTIERDHAGNVTRDETYDLGIRIANWEPYAHWFGVVAPRKPSLFERVREWFR